MENAARSMSDKLYNFKVQDAQVDNMKLQNDMLKEQIRGQQISNAQKGVLTPIYETGGDLVKTGTDIVKNIFGGNDIVQEALDVPPTTTVSVRNRTLPNSSGTASVQKAPRPANGPEVKKPSSSRCATQTRLVLVTLIT